MKQKLAGDQDLVRALLAEALPQTLVTRVSKIELRVLHERQGRFRTEVFERYQRSRKALVMAMMEMDLQGLSTGKVKAVTEELCGHEFSSSTVSRIVAQLDEAGQSGEDFQLEGTSEQLADSRAAWCATGDQR